MFDTAPDEADTPDELAGCYLAALRAVIEDEAPDPSGDRRTAVEDGNADALTIGDASRILAIDADGLDGAAIEAELLDRILIEMSNAVVDVDTLANEVEIDRSGKELQQRIEGRAPMSLLEYAAIRHAIAARRS